MSATATTTRVLILARPEPGAIELVTRSLPMVAAGVVLVRILAAGFCGTDLHIAKWNAWAQSSYRPPVALGHEFCGEVVQVGEGVEHLRVGTRVVAETHLSCGNCRQCRLNRAHTCENLVVFSRLDRGGFADQAVVPAKLLRRVPDGVPSIFATLFEPLGIALRAVMESEVRGANLLVVGCGPIGLSAIAVARHFGANRIFASDPSQDRRSLACALGAHETFDPIGQQSKSISQPDEIDVAIDTSGNAGAIKSALSVIGAGGQLLLLGLPDREVALDLTRNVILREVAIRGVYGRLVDQTWLQAERLMTNPAFDLSAMITRVFALDGFRAAFKEAMAGNAGKIIFKMD
jgi:threonine 3-dehydrogenase